MKAAILLAIMVTVVVTVATLVLATVLAKGCMMIANAVQVLTSAMKSETI